MWASSAPGRMASAIDQRVSPGATVWVWGGSLAPREAASGGAEEGAGATVGDEAGVASVASCGLAPGLGEALGASCGLGPGLGEASGVSAHVRDMSGASASRGEARAAPIGAAVSMADPMRALAPARARRERDRLVPNRVTRNLVALRRPAGASRRVARCARAEDRRPQANSATPTRARTHTTSVSGALGVIGGAA